MSTLRSVGNLLIFLSGNAKTSSVDNVKLSTIFFAMLLAVCPTSVLPEMFVCRKSGAECGWGIANGLSIRLLQLPGWMLLFY